jgi:flagellar hook assembly protein FlgD
VFDILGRRVMTLVDEAQPASQHGISWDGKNASGKAVALGIYFA